MALILLSACFYQLVNKAGREVPLTRFPQVILHLHAEPSVRRAAEYLL
jgi:hypothetical protein